MAVTSLGVLETNLDIAYDGTLDAAGWDNLPPDSTKSTSKQIAFVALVCATVEGSYCVHMLLHKAAQSCWVNQVEDPHSMHKANRYAVRQLSNLLAFMVMLVKLGSLVEFRFGPAVIAFVLCVAMSMLASITFDPHVIWESDNEPG